MPRDKYGATVTDNATRVYVAGSSTDLQKARTLIESLRAAGFKVYDWTKSFEEYPPRNPVDYARDDIRAIQDADVLVWYANPPSYGAHYEAGYASALGIPVVCYGFPDDERIFCHLHQSVSSFPALLEWIARNRARRHQWA